MRARCIVGQMGSGGVTALGETKWSKKFRQSAPSFGWCERIQITGTPSSRHPCTMRLMIGTISRDAGTGIGPPGATNAFCMSITTSAVLPADP